ncbi:hypothetical protein [Marinoscillum furvescens]|uniref:Outer membrane protein with beta-barrel domain n=1 Tax=Marinoscillum furvescens DSM 4134 TaxID=1122208 RepID=A0A3D9L3X9_MARFU|nr:hypothetical protein [Marinoscillum furvescens]RED97974.1 hypothetical protein C7460_111115 [Marinoscillum furvescens DSM 4134]
MRVVYTALCLSMLLLDVKAQNPDSAQAHVSTFNKWVLKVDGTDLVHPKDPALTLAMEHRFLQRFSVSQELGYVMAVYETNEPASNFIGVKTSTDLRAYIAPYSPSGSLYVGIAGDYRFLKVKDRLTLGYGCTGDDLWSCNYLSSEETEVSTNRWTGILKFGVQEQAHPRVLIEVDAGIGLGYLSSKNSANDENVTIFEFENQGDGNQLLSNTWSHIFTFNAKVGIVLSQYD